MLRHPPPPQTLAVISRKKRVNSLSSDCSRKIEKQDQPPPTPPLVPIAATPPHAPLPPPPPPLLTTAAPSPPPPRLAHRHRALCPIAAPSSPQYPPRCHRALHPAGAPCSPSLCPAYRHCARLTADALVRICHAWFPAIASRPPRCPAKAPVSPCPSHRTTLPRPSRCPAPCRRAACTPFLPFRATPRALDVCPTHPCCARLGRLPAACHVQPTVPTAPCSQCPPRRAGISSPQLAYIAGPRMHPCVRLHSRCYPSAPRTLRFPRRFPPRPSFANRPCRVQTASPSSRQTRLAPRRSSTHPLLFTLESFYFIQYFPHLFPPPLGPRLG